jgi:hypothetical protein
MKDLGMAGDLEARMAPGETSPDLKNPRAINDFSQSRSRALTILWIESGLAFSFRKSDELNGSPFFDLITPGVPSSES